MIEQIKKLIFGNKGSTGLSNLMPYSHFEKEQGILFTRDGSIIKLYKFEGIPQEKCSETEIKNYQYLIEQALSRLPENVTVHKADYYLPEKYVHEKNECLFDADVKEYFDGRIRMKQYSYLYLTFKNSISNPLGTKLVQMGYDLNGASTTELNATDVINSCNSFQQSINIGSLKLKEITAEEINKHIHHILNVNFTKQSTEGYYLESDLQATESHIKNNEICMKYVTMLSQPDTLKNSIRNDNGMPVNYTNPFKSLPFPHSTHTVIHTVNTEAVLKKLDREKFFNKSISDDAKNKIKTEGQEIRFNQVRAATIKVREQDIKLYQVGIAVGVYASNEKHLNERTNKTINAFDTLGFTPYKETLDNLNLHWSFFPGMANNFYRTLTTTGECASVYINIDHQRSYDKKGMICIDREGYPANFQIMSDKTDNKHTLVIGGTGGGKTFFHQHVLASRLAENPNAINILLDEKGDFKKIVEFYGGKHIDYKPGSPIKLNPFKINSGSEEKERVEFIVKFVLSLYTKEYTILEFSVLMNWVNGFIKLENAEQNLKGFYGFVLQNLQDIEEKSFPKDEFLAGLQMYATGIYSHLFNHDEIDDFTSYKLLSFDFVAIKDAMYFKQVFACVTEIINVIVQKNPYVPKYIDMDECWSQLNRNARFIVQYTRTGRSLNTFLTLMTQGINELLSAEVGATIIALFDNNILLNNTDEDQIDKIKTALSLTNHQTEMFRGLKTGDTFREIFVKQKDKATVIGIEIPNIFHGLYTTIPQEKERYEQLLRKHNNNYRQAQIEFAKEKEVVNI